MKVKRIIKSLTLSSLLFASGGGAHGNHDELPLCEGAHSLSGHLGGTISARATEYKYKWTIDRNTPYLRMTLNGKDVWVPNFEIELIDPDNINACIAFRGSDNPNVLPSKGAGFGSKADAEQSFVARYNAQLLTDNVNSIYRVLHAEGDSDSDKKLTREKLLEYCSQLGRLSYLCVDAHERDHLRLYRQYPYIPVIVPVGLEEGASSEKTRADLIYYIEGSAKNAELNFLIQSLSSSARAREAVAFYLTLIVPKSMENKVLNSKYYKDKWDYTKSLSSRELATQLIDLEAGALIKGLTRTYRQARVDFRENRAYVRDLHNRHKENIIKDLCADLQRQNAVAYDPTYPSLNFFTIYTGTQTLSSKDSANITAAPASFDSLTAILREQNKQLLIILAVLEKNAQIDSPSQQDIDAINAAAQVLEVLHGHKQRLQANVSLVVLRQELLNLSRTAEGKAITESALKFTFGAMAVASKTRNAAFRASIEKAYKAVSGK